MQARWPLAVVFDLDGTLVDSAPDVALALNAALGEQGLPPYDLDAVKAMVGGGAANLVERALKGRNVTADAAAERSCRERFVAHYQASPVIDSRVYPGGLAALNWCVETGRRVGLCTNKPTEITHQVLQGLGIEHQFGAVIGGTSGYAKKPDPAPLAAALAALGVDTRDAVMVGDSAADVGAAKALGCPVIAVSYGYSRLPADALGADMVIAQLAELPDACEGLAARIAV